MDHQEDGSPDRLSSLDSTGHLYRNLSNSLVQGQTYRSSTRETTTIIVSIAAAHRISSGIALNLGNHSKVDVQPEKQGQGQEASCASPPREGEFHNSL
jgi:hypothetical protein